MPGRKLEKINVLVPVIVAVPLKLLCMELIGLEEFGCETMVIVMEVLLIRLTVIRALFFVLVLIGLAAQASEVPNSEISVTISVYEEYIKQTDPFNHVNFEDHHSDGDFYLQRLATVKLEGEQALFWKGIAEIEVEAPINDESAQRLPWTGKPLYITVSEDESMSGRLINIYEGSAQGFYLLSSKAMILEDVPKFSISSSGKTVIYSEFLATYILKRLSKIMGETENNPDG